MNEMEAFRQEIDILDEELLRILKQRFVVCQKVAEHKKLMAIPVMQPERIVQVKQRCTTLGAKYGITSEFVEQLYDLIIQESCVMETKIINFPSEQT